MQPHLESSSFRSEKAVQIHQTYSGAQMYLAIGSRYMSRETKRTDSEEDAKRLTTQRSANRFLRENNFFANDEIPRHGARHESTAKNYL